MLSTRWCMGALSTARLICLSTHIDSTNLSVSPHTDPIIPLSHYWPWHLSWGPCCSCYLSDLISTLSSVSLSIYWRLHLPVSLDTDHGFCHPTPPHVPVIWLPASYRSCHLFVSPHIDNAICLPAPRLTLSSVCQSYTDIIIGQSSYWPCHMSACSHTNQVTLNINGSPIESQWGSRKYPR